MGSAARAGRLHRNPSVMNAVRPPAVAGRFYPSDPDELRATVERFLDVGWAGPDPKAIIAPHAGYIFSGPTAGRAYASLQGVIYRIRWVILAVLVQRTSDDRLALL